MSKRSGIGGLSILKLAARLYKYPHVYKKLADLQVEKWLFNHTNRLHPSRDAGQARKIRQLSIRITDLCNLRCIMCGQWGEHGFLHGKNLKELKQKEVPLARYQECLRDLVSHGHTPIIYLWGGEPTMYDGWLDLLQTAKELNLPTSIATNGTQLVRFAEGVVDVGMYLTQISIDGPTAAIHNSIRRSPGCGDSFAAIHKGIDALREAREKRGASLPLIASLTTVSRDNAPYLADIYDEFKDKADLFVFYPAWWISEERADLHAADFTRRFGFEPTLHRGWVGGWTPEDYAALSRQFELLREKSRGLHAPPAIVIPDITAEDDLETYYTDHTATFGFDECISIFQVVEIDSNGDLSPCRDYHDYVVGNIKEHTITELWNSERFRAFRTSLRQEGLMPACARCCGLMGY